MRRLIAILFSIAILAPTVLGGAAAFAQTPATPAEDAPTPITLGIPIAGVRQVSGIAQYINLGYRYLVSVVLIAAIVMVVWGGFRYLLGSANVGNVQRGKETIRDAVVGMLIVVGAYVILSTVNPRTVELRNLNLSSIQRQDFGLGITGSGECSSDAQCPAGSHCVESGYIFNTDEDTALGMTAGAGAVGAAAGGYFGGFYGAVIGGAGGIAFGSYHALGHRSMRCSDGSVNAPCNDNSSCTGGNVCYTNWHVCGPANGQSVGEPCQEDAQCSNNNCQTLPANYLGQCVFEGCPATCRGTVQRLTESVYRRGENGRGFRVPESHRCSINEDCVEGQHLVCGGPPGLPNKFCIYDSPSQSAGFVDINGIPVRTVGDGELCFATPGQIYPYECGGTRTEAYTCMFCPTSGSRNWQRLIQGDPHTYTIGVCHDRTLLNTSCTGSAAP